MTKYTNTGLLGLRLLRQPDRPSAVSEKSLRFRNVWERNRGVVFLFLVFIYETFYYLPNGAVSVAKNNSKEDAPGAAERDVRCYGGELVLVERAFASVTHP